MHPARTFPEFTKGADLSPSDRILRLAIEFLPIINAGPLFAETERVAPHRGFAKKAITSGVEGPWRDEGWQRLKLNHGTRSAITDHETGQVCGKKRLHFCRAHMRVSNGKPGIVRSHWRGDSTLGIVAKTYVVSQ